MNRLCFFLCGIWVLCGAFSSCSTKALIYSSWFIKNVSDETVCVVTNFNDKLSEINTNTEYYLSPGDYCSIIRGVLLRKEETPQFASYDEMIVFIISAFPEAKISIYTISYDISGEQKRDLLASWELNHSVPHLSEMQEETSERGCWPISFYTYWPTEK